MECILPTHLLMFSNGVIGKKLRFIFLGIKIACNITFLWIKARIFFNFVDLISSHKSYIPRLDLIQVVTSYVLIWYSSYELKNELYIFSISLIWFLQIKVTYLSWCNFKKKWFRMIFSTAKYVLKALFICLQIIETS